jgi:putative ABC transport system permease protein
MRLLPLDLRAALRCLAAAPGPTAAAVLTLALGLGLATGVFHVADAVLLRPLDAPHPEQLIDLRATSDRHAGERVSITPADFLAWRAGSVAGLAEWRGSGTGEERRGVEKSGLGKKTNGGAPGVFVHLGAYVPFGSFDLTGEGEPERLARHLVSDGLLEALGTRPALGRLFIREEYADAGRCPVLLSHRLWRGRFGADPAVAGTRLTLSGRTCEVVGVLPPRFRILGGDPDLLAPLVFGPGAEQDREAATLGAIGRLRPGVTFRQAQAELDAVALRARAAHDDETRGSDQAAEDRARPSLLPLTEVLVRDARPALLALCGAVALVLLLAGLDACGLHLARTAARRRDLAVRAALGAGGLRLALPVLAESLALALAGGLGGLLLAAAALRFLPDPRGVYLSRAVPLGLDARACAAALLLALATGLAAGLPPALRAARARIPGALAARRSALDLLVVPQVAVAAVLLAGAAVALGGFLRLNEADLGVDPRPVLTLEIALPAAAYPDEARTAAFYTELLARLEKLPGVTAAGAVKELPPDTPWSFQPIFDGEPEPSNGGAGEATAGWQLATPGTFAALGTPLLAGRAFGPADRAGSPPVALASASAARTLLANRPLGRRVNFNGIWHEVIGVVGDLIPPGGEPQPVFYLPHAQTPVPADYLRTMAIAVRAKGVPESLAGPVREALANLDSNLPATDLQTFEQRLAAATPVARARFGSAFLALFAVLALALAAAGIYALLAYLVGQRAPELGVRQALGAGRGALLRLILGRGLALTLTGLAIGLPAAAALGRLAASRLPAAQPPALWELTGIGLLLAAAALAASLIPARRAAGIDPAAVLRSGPGGR